MKRALLLVALIVAACQKESTEPAPPMKEGTPPMPMTTAASATASQSNTLSGFATPESVLWDPDQDVYFVSNINGQPLAADDNGFISRINPETLQIDAKWIDAAKPDIILNAPKGMAILGDDLYVADLSVVRKFDRKTGKPKGEIPIPGSTFLEPTPSGRLPETSRKKSRPEANSIARTASMSSMGKSGWSPSARTSFIRSTRAKRPM